jgi:acetyl-CoA carboxylase carboxyl transferase subunit alpha
MMTKVMFPKGSRQGLRAGKSVSPDSSQLMNCVRASCDGFIELRGDRRCSNDPGIVGGLAKIGHQPVIVLVHDAKRHLNGSRPSGITDDGFRKVFRLMELAEKFRHPILIFATLPRSVAKWSREEAHEALSGVTQLHKMWQLRVPAVFVALGEWTYQDIFSSWAVDRVLAFRYGSVYLPYQRKAFGTGELLVKAEILDSFGIFDLVVPDPSEGAPATPDMMGRRLRCCIADALQELLPLNPDRLIIERATKAGRLSLLLGKWQGLKSE